MKGKKKYLIIGVIVIIGIFVVVANMNKPVVEETIGGYKEGPRVQVEKVKKDNIEAKISSSGKLEAVDTKTIFLDASNKVDSIVKEVGDSVKKGDLILILDQEAQTTTEKQIEALQSQLVAAQKTLSNLLGQSSKGDVLSAQANIEKLKNQKEQSQNSITDLKNKIANSKDDLAEAEKTLKTNKELLEEGLASQKEVDDLVTKVDRLKQSISADEKSAKLTEESLKAIDLQIQTAQYNLDVLLNKVQDNTKESSIATAESSIKNLEQQIYSAQQKLEKASTQVIAPIDGIITYLPKEEGMSIMAGDRLVTIVDPSTLKVECDISPYYAADLKMGLDAIVKYAGSKTIEVNGKVTKIAATAEQKVSSSGESTVLPVEVTVNQPGEIIKPGFSVDVKVITDTRENVCIVPLLAVLEDDEEDNYVFVVSEDGTLIKKKVVQGLSNGLYIEVEGVEEGELIVSSPADYLKEGTKVSYEKLGDM